MNKRVLSSVLTLLYASVPVIAFAQNPVPTSQPSVLMVIREDVKYGHGADHESVEAGWPAAFAKAKSPQTYIGMTSLTGANEAWFVVPMTNWKALGDQMKFENSDPVLSAELARLSRADAEHVSNSRTMHLIGRPDLSAGAFPKVSSARFYEITFLRVRLGHEQEFENAAKIYQAAYKRVAPTESYRLYQAVAGVVGPTYVVFVSAPSLADFDRMQSIDGAVMGSFSASDMQAMQKLFAEGMVNVETQRFAVNGRMSYVDDATAAADMAFWRPGIKASK